MPDLTARYQRAISAGQLQRDPAQAQLVKQLTALAMTLNAGQQPSQGLYIYGPVGRGKTMLMDWFFAALGTPRKSRLHFHHFMRRIHQALAEQQGEMDPLQRIAKQWAAQYDLLCFDEFLVEDIADAMLLGTLWQALFAAGVTLVATSNSAPHELYRHGLQRSRFLPTITLLEHYCQVLSLDAGVDYRRATTMQWQTLGLKQQTHWLHQQAEHYYGALEGSTNLTVLDRPIPCLGHNNQIAVFDFMALCSGPRSQLDYMVLCQRFVALAIANVPLFLAHSDTAILHGVEENYQREHSSVFVSKLDNEARRFIALVDECYEQKVLLWLTAEFPPECWYQASQLSHAFERTVSRLYEMQRWALPSSTVGKQPHLMPCDSL